MYPKSDLSVTLVVGESQFGPCDVSTTRTLTKFISDLINYGNICLYFDPILLLGLVYRVYKTREVFDFLLVFSLRKGSLVHVDDPS